MDMPQFVSELGLDNLAVEASDVGDSLALRADCLAGAGVGAVAEAKLVHLNDHVLHTTGSLYSIQAHLTKGLTFCEALADIG